jgi:hypothetical protein
MRRFRGIQTEPQLNSRANQRDPLFNRRRPRVTNQITLILLIVSLPVLGVTIAAAIAYAKYRSTLAIAAAAEFIFQIFLALALLL